MSLISRSGCVRTLLALVVVLSVAVTPVAATPDDGGLLGGDDGDGVVGNATDAVDDTVESTAESATDPVTDPVTDSDAGTDPADTVGSATDTVNDTVQSTAGAVSDTAETVSETASSATDGAVPTESEGSSATPAAEPAAGGSLERRVGTGDLPVGVGQLPLEQLPATGEDAPVEPEDSPYGSEAEGRLDACTFPVRQDDLPVETLPGPGDLPVEPNVPGVPVGLLTPRTVTQIAYAVPPKPCEVYDPHDPSVDPTEPPTNPGAVAETSEVDVGSDGAATNGGSRARLEENGLEGIALWGVIANREQVGGGERLRVTDGRTARYLYLESVGLLVVEKRTVRGDVTVGVFGNNFAASAACDGGNASNVAPSADDPTGACEYGYTGLPSAVGPETIVELVRNPPTESPIQGE